LDYLQAKAEGYKYVARDYIGGECVHKVEPKYDGGYWKSKEWRYVDGHACRDTKKVLTIDEAIRLDKEITFRPTKEPVLIEITCIECKKPFIAPSTRYKYCSEECKKAAAKKRD